MPSSPPAKAGRLVLLCLAALFLGLIQKPSTANAGGTDTITFEPAPLPNGSKLVDSWVEKDLQFTTPNKLAINDISDAGYPFDGTPYLQCLFGESPLTIVTVDGQPFSLLSVDLAEYSTVFEFPKTITFVGTHSDDTISSVTFTTDGIIDGNGAGQDFETYTFPTTFTDLRRVTVDTDRYSMDNLQFSVGSPTATPVPTPVPTPTPALTPAITSAATATTQINQPFAFQVTATHSPTSYGAEFLPAGLILNTTTGLISGVATTGGTYYVGLSATNATGTGSATLILSVSVPAAPAPAPAPVIISATAATARVGQAFVYLITASNSPVSFAAAGLPDGLTADPNSGLITGTPATAGVYSVLLSATNAVGTGTAPLQLTVNAVVPSVTVSAAGGGVAREDGAAGKVIVHRAGPVDADLVVRYKVKGSARAGVDYKVLNGSVTIPAGSVQAKVNVKPIDNGTAEGNRTLKIKLTPSADGSYALGADATAKITIIDDD